MDKLSRCSYSSMNSDLLFEISKYLEKKTNILSLDQAYESVEVLKQSRENASAFLNNKLGARPSKKDLECKNIIRKRELIDFDYVHTVLEQIVFRENDSKISPRIANMAGKIDFGLKRKMIIQKLGLNQLEDPPR